MLLTNFIYRIGKKVDLLKFIVEKPISEWNLQEYTTCIALIAFPIGVLLYYNKHKFGWFILTVLISYFFSYQFHRVITATPETHINMSDYIGLGVFIYGYYLISKNGKLKELKIKRNIAQGVIVLSLLVFMLLFFLST